MTTLTGKGARTVGAYVTAQVRARRLRARLDAKMAALAPLRERVQRAENLAQMKRARLRGAQMGLAERLVGERLAAPTSTG